MLGEFSFPIVRNLNFRHVDRSATTGQKNLIRVADDHENAYLC